MDIEGIIDDVCKNGSCSIDLNLLGGNLENE